MADGDLYICASDSDVGGEVRVDASSGGTGRGVRSSRFDGGRSRTLSSGVFELNLHDHQLRDPDEPGQQENDDRKDQSHLDGCLTPVLPNPHVRPAR